MSHTVKIRLRKHVPVGKNNSNDLNFSIFLYFVTGVFHDVLQCVIVCWYPSILLICNSIYRYVLNFWINKTTLEKNNTFSSFNFYLNCICKDKPLMYKRKNVQIKLLGLNIPVLFVVSAGFLSLIMDWRWKSICTRVISLIFSLSISILSLRHTAKHAQSYMYARRHLSYSTEHEFKNCLNY